MFEFRWVLKNLQGTRVKYVISMILNILLASFVLVWPILTKYIVNYILIGVPDQTGEIVKRTNQLLPILFLWMGIVLLRNTMNLFFVYFKESSAQFLARKIRLKMFESLMAQENAFFAKNSAGDLMTRLTGDLDMVIYNVRHIIFAMVNTVIIFASSVIYFFTINWVLTLCLLSVLPFIFITSRRFSKEMRPMYMKNREKMSQMNERAQENISANKTVRAFAREDYEIEIFDKSNREYLETVLQTNKTWLSIWPLPEFLSQFLNVIVLVVGGLLVISGNKTVSMTIPDLAAFMSLVWALSATVRNIGNILNDFQRFFPSASKVIEIFYAQPRIVSRNEAVEIKERLKGEIIFENVSLTLKDSKIIKDVSFKIEPGQTVAIVGETGAGKTTLVGFLARFCDPDEGNVFIDGENVKNYNLQDLRKSIGMATQDVFLFSDTIDGNISFGIPDMPEQTVHASAVMADADEFIRETEQGYDTIIGERGMGLSGGQRQRIALARAMAIEPPILVLDDTTSAVDMKTERYIWDQLHNLPFNCTKIIIAQRVITVADADCIFVMQNGQITQRGTHAELIKQDGFYKEIYELQSQQTE